IWLAKASAGRPTIASKGFALHRARNMMTRSSTGGPMSFPQVSAVLEDLVDGWSSHDADKILSLLVDNCVYEDRTLAAVNKGKQQIRAFIDSVFAAFPDFDMKLSYSFTTGPWAAAEWKMTATHRGEMQDIPATDSHI